MINHRSPLQTEKSQPSGQRIMTETRQTSFPVLSVYPRVGISLSAPETDHRFYLSYTSKYVMSLLTVGAKGKRRHVVKRLYISNTTFLHTDPNQDASIILTSDKIL